MKSKLLIVAVLTLLTMSASSQRYTLSELESLSSIAKWQDAQDVLIRQGWDFESTYDMGYDEELGIGLTEINYKFQPNAISTRFILTAFYDDQLSSCEYVTINRNVYLSIYDEMIAKGYKKKNTDIDGRTITTFYENNLFVAWIMISNDTQQTKYWISISKKR